MLSIMIDVTDVHLRHIMFRNPLYFELKMHCLFIIHINWYTMFYCDVLFLLHNYWKNLHNVLLAVEREYNSWQRAKAKCSVSFHLFLGFVIGKKGFFKNICNLYLVIKCQSQWILSSTWITTGKLQNVGSEIYIRVTLFRWAGYI